VGLGTCQCSQTNKSPGFSNKTCVQRLPFDKCLLPCYHTFWRFHLFCQWYCIFFPNTRQRRVLGVQRQGALCRRCRVSGRSQRDTKNLGNPQSSTIWWGLSTLYYEGTFPLSRVLPRSGTPIPLPPYCDLPDDARRR